MEVIRKDFFPEDLKPILDENEIEGCIAVQADQSEKETEFLLGLAEENPFIKGVVGWVDLCAENIEDRLRFFANNPLFKGVRHILQAEEKEFMLQANFIYGMGKLKQFNLTYDILVYSSQLETVLELVALFPEQPFIINHIAKPDIKNQEVDIWGKQMMDLSKFPNVWCKISGMLTETDWESWDYKDIQPYIDLVFNAFKKERLVYGSDWPVCLLAGSYKEQLSVLEEYTAQLSVEDKTLLMGGNAIEFYNLNK